MATEYLSFAGWEKNLKLSNGIVEVIITLEVGPRIISYRPVEGRSVFKLVDGEAGKSKEEVWRIRGGHRLWIAPEDFGKDDSLSYALDNSEVEHTIEDESTVRVSNLIEKPTKIRREMVVTLEKASPKITIEHRITNQGDTPLEIAPWALSVMAAGGYALLSQPPQGTHPQDYLPNRSIVAWPFTDLSEEKLRVGRQTISVRQQGPPFKIGLRHSEGWAAYILDDHLFMKTVPFSLENCTLTSVRTLRFLQTVKFSNLRPSGLLREFPQGQRSCTRNRGQSFQESTLQRLGRMRLSWQRSSRIRSNCFRNDFSFECVALSCNCHLGHVTKKGRLGKAWASKASPNWVFLTKTATSQFVSKPGSRSV